MGYLLPARPALWVQVFPTRWGWLEAVRGAALRDGTSLAHRERGWLGMGSYSSPCPHHHLVRQGAFAPLNAYEETKAVPRQLCHDKVQLSPGLHAASGAHQAPCRNHIGQRMREIEVGWWVPGENCVECRKTWEPTGRGYLSEWWVLVLGMLRSLPLCRAVITRGAKLHTCVCACSHGAGLCSEGCC